MSHMKYPVISRPFFSLFALLLLLGSWSCGENASTESGEATEIVEEEAEVDPASKPHLFVQVDNLRMREAAGINVKTTRYGQKALAFTVTHEVAHENVSTEIHRTGGPFTLVPLPDFEGKPSSAIVWMEEGPKAKALAEMDVEPFEEAMNIRSCGVLGTLRLNSARTIWPIISQHAEHLSGERIALVAGAAHVIPPIGAQGLNMSLNDIRALLDLATTRPEGLGDIAMLDAYHKARIGDIRLRVAGITLLNRTSMLSAPPLRDARAAGLNALYSFAPLRKSIMQMGLGAKGGA